MLLAHLEHSVLRWQECVCLDGVSCWVTDIFLKCVLIIISVVTFGKNIDCMAEALVEDGGKV